MFRLMIADDERIIRETICKLIPYESLDIKLIGLCENGLEAYDMILDEYPDIVLTDIRMPGLSGLEMIEKIQLLDSNIHFIILSGYDDFSYAQKAMKYGVKHYLLKPCNEHQIIESIKDTIHDIKQSTFTPPHSEASLNTFLQKIKNLAFNFWSSDPAAQKKAVFELQTLLNKVYDSDFLYTLISHFLLESLTLSRQLSKSQISELLQKLKGFHEKSDILNTFYLFLHSQDSRSMQDQSLYKDFIKTILSYVETHLSDPSLSLKYISENILYMNVDYVSKQFIKQTGTKFSNYLCNLRIEYAKKLWEDDKTSKVYEVAEKVGCGNNPQYFTYLFKKYTGLTPSAYIAKISDNTL